MTVDRYDIAEAAETGAALLDRRFPDWAEQIDLDSLEMSVSETCILGQLYGSYWQGLAALTMTTPGFADPIDYGFILPVYLDNNENGDQYWEQLDRAWRDEIANRDG